MATRTTGSGLLAGLLRPPSSAPGATAWRRGIVVAEVAAVAVLAALVALGGRYIDDRGGRFGGQTGIDRWGYAHISPAIGSPTLTHVAEIGSPAVLVVGVALVTAFAFFSDRRRAAVCALGPVVAVLLTEVVFKPLVGRRLGGALSYPSGHVTDTAALAAAVVVALPRRLRLLAVLPAAAVVVAVGVAVVAIGWHYPTDALAGAADGLAGVLLVDAASRLVLRGAAARSR